MSIEHSSFDESQFNFQYLKFEKWDDKDIGVIRFNRPQKMNALSYDMLKELKSLIKKLNQMDIGSLRGLILTGEGDRAFIAGADIEELSQLSTKDAYEMALLGQHVTMLLEKSPFPTIAAVDGFALGGGLEMAMGCDLILCTEKSIFGLPETKLGLIPGFGGTQRLTKFIGRQKAKEIIFTGRKVNSNEAFKLGLIFEVFPTKDLMLERIKDLFSEMKKNSPLAIANAKKVMNLGNDLPLDEGLNLELEHFSLSFSTEDMKEGTRAFVEKRLPRFTGK